MNAYPISVLGFGDNVVDKYEHIGTMYPGGTSPSSLRSSAWTAAPTWASSARTLRPST